MNINDTELTDQLSEIDILRFENALHRWGFSYGEVEQVWSSIKSSQLTLAKRVVK